MRRRRRISLILGLPLLGLPLLLAPALRGPAEGAGMSVNGMVVTSHPLAAQAGLRILQAGGNAFDAAVASAAVLAVVEPLMSGLGGVGGYALIHDAETGDIRSLDFIGAAPVDGRDQPDSFRLGHAPQLSGRPPLNPNGEAHAGPGPSPAPDRLDHGAGPWSRRGHQCLRDSARPPSG